MRYILMITIFTFMASFSGASKAASQDACAIWICLPGGFPQGCSGAHKEFKRRLKKGRSPLPNLASCTTGPNGEKTNGRYNLGYENYEECNEGYVLIATNNNIWGNYNNHAHKPGMCYKQSCADRVSAGYSPKYGYRQGCEGYPATVRQKPRFIEMWVNGEYLGKFFYQ